MRNGVFCFVAHVGETEGFSAEFAVAGIDDEVMFFAQLFRHRQNVDATIVCTQVSVFERKPFSAKKSKPVRFTQSWTRALVLAWRW